MRKVIGMGETIMDIIFHGAQPTAAVPGGSSFNSIISIGRAGIPAVFVGETGHDEVGRRIADFLNANHVDTSYLRMRSDIQSAVSLAFLDERNDAHYMFYKQPPRTLEDFIHPTVETDDIVQFGSYYALNPYIRPQVKSFLEYARSRNAILYYDLNYRRTYKDRIRELLPSIHENFRLADLVRGSADDFEVTACVMRRKSTGCISRPTARFFSVPAERKASYCSHPKEAHAFRYRPYAQSVPSERETTSMPDSFTG